MTEILVGCSSHVTVDKELTIDKCLVTVTMQRLITQRRDCHALPHGRHDHLRGVRVSAVDGQLHGHALLQDHLSPDQYVVTAAIHPRQIEGVGVLAGRDLV